MLSPRSDKDALIFSQVAQMKFKPTQCPLLKQKKQQPQSHHPSSQFQRLQSTISNFYTPSMVNKQIKYLFSLSNTYFLIGNQNQLDLIGINGASYGFLDTEYLWSLNLKEVIMNIAIDIKKCFLALVFEKSIQIFTYNSKKLNEFPKPYKTIQLKSQVRFIQFAKQAYLAIFYDQSFEVYIMEENGKLIKKCQKPYGISRDYKVFSVPQAVDSVLNIFFEKQTSEEKTFSLWSMKVIFELVEIKMDPVTKVYDIMKSLKKRVRISNFSKDTFFLNMGCEIIAAKKGFIIDSISVDIQGQQSKLVYLSNEKLLHVDENKVQLYDIKIDVTVKPNRIKIKSIDSLEIDKKPPNSKLIDVITFGKDNFGIFFQVRPQYNNYKKGEINYWFAVTQYIRKEEKIKKIFNYGMQISTLQPEVIEAKCDMARKIGLEQKQIYLQIWNRTSKSTIEDYKFLLATKDFKTIYNQIEKKLKKQSMSFRELFNIFQSCLDILTGTVYERDSCTQQNIQQYLTCHLLVRKLKLFKQIEMYQRNHHPHHPHHSFSQQQQQQSSPFMITIQQFYEYKNFDIKGYLIDHVNMFCQEKKNTITKIRLILRAFRFVYRVIYRELLDEIIVNAKSNLLALLQVIPEILPFLRRVSEDEEVSLYEGIWKDITESEWETNLHIEKIKTIDNTEKVDDLVKSVWYKRYWLTTHDLINMSKHQILQVHQQNVSEQIFYYFISSIFLKVEERRNLEVLVEFVENFYENLPQHIRGKIFLYVDLWAYYCQHHDQAKRNKLNLNEFLKLKGHDLFKYFFDLQKVRKNCILKEIKPIYLRAKSEYAGIDVFNQCLLQYFESDLSQISDLKYLLNRMNNEKSQFHGNNVETYEILVQAMQIKLTIGGSHDIPIEQILIYIENIPLSKDNDVMAELETVQRINEECDRFREMKLNMSIRDIIDNCQDVVSRLIEYEFRRHRIMRIRSVEQLKKITYSLLAQIQTVKQKIYGDDMNNLPFFIYISQILQNEEQIHLASELLHDQYLNRYFTVNQIIIENLVLYMYKKRFSISTVFKDHTGYIRRLVTLLPENNNTREFILNELEFALLLSAPGEGVEFPISDKLAFPKVNELMDIVKFLPADFILSVDIQRVYQTMHKMQQIEIMNNEDQDHSIQDQYFDQEFITRHQVYQVFIMRMIELNLVQDVLGYIRGILKLDFANRNYNTLYLVMLILKISPELNDDTKHGLTGLVAYAFQDQEAIIKVIQFYINVKMTSLEKGKRIAKDVRAIIDGRINYNIEKGLLFKDAFFQEVGTDPKLQQNARLLVQSTWNHLRSTKAQFRDPLYELIYIIICHEPYMLAKLIYLQLDVINFKQLRSFISYLSVEEIFDELKVLQFSKRVFYVVLHSRMENQEINLKLFSYERLPLDRQVFTKDYYILEEDVDVKLMKSIKACDNKSKIVLGPQRVKRSHRQSDEESIHIKIHHPENITESSPSQYPYEDSDDDQGDEHASPVKKYRSKAKRGKIEFDQKSQRNKFMNRQGKKLGSYMKEHTQTEHGSERHTVSGHKGFKIKSRITSMSHAVDKEIKIKRAMTLSYNPENSRVKQSAQSNLLQQNSHSRKMKLMDFLQPQSSILRTDEQPFSASLAMRKKPSNKRKSSEYISSSKIQKAEQKQFAEINEKQRSAYNLKGTQTTCQSLINDLFEDYNVEKKEFNLSKLTERAKQYADNQAAFAQQLKKLVIALYDTIEADGELKMNLIKSIATTFEEAGMKPNIMSVYSQLYSLLERYGINICIKRLLSAEKLLQETNVSNLYEASKQSIIEASTIENLSKLSKVISLAFRKNIYEQQIAYFGLCKIINELQTQSEIQQVQINLYFDEIHQIVNKFSTKMLRQKGQTQFKEIDNGPLKNKLINLILTVVGNKGDKLSVNALKKSLNLSEKL